MKIKLEYWIIGALLLFSFITLGVLDMQSTKIDNLNKDLFKWMNNFEQIQNSNNATIALTQKQFIEQLDNKTDSLFKANKVKPKDVSNVTYITNNYTIDSVGIKVTNRQKKDSLYSYDMKLDTNCLMLRGVIYTKDSIAPKIDITKLSYNNGSIIAEVIRKEKRTPWISFLWDWKKRNTYKEQIIQSDCGDIIVKKINIEK